MLTPPLKPDSIAGMYIKKVRKANQNSKKVYEYLHLVDNVRTNKGPRQRLILNLGTVDIVPEQYKELANCIEALLTGQKQLFSTDPKIEKQARRAADKILAKGASDQPVDNLSDSEITAAADYQSVDTASLQAGQLRSLGPEHICHATWQELHLDELLMAQGISTHVLPLMKALIIGRLTAPGSELRTWDWVENRSALYELTGRPLRASLNSLYRAGDRLFKCKEALEEHLSGREANLFDLPETMCFFDLTNTYFEGQAAANPKARRGHSKEKRSDCKLLTLALVIDEQGFAKYSRLYPGNQVESRALAQIIESLVQLRPNLAKERTVIIDAGIATKDNIAFLKEHHFHYIVVHRGRSDFTPEDTDRMQIIQQTERYTLEVKRRQKDNEAFLLCRSTTRQGKDRGIRTRQENLFLERLQYYHDGLGKKGRTKAYPKVIEMIGRLREKYPRASKRYDVEVVAADKPDKSVQARAVVWKKRSSYDPQDKFDGCYVLRTDRLDLSDDQIWKTYVMLTRVENAFRSMKSSLGLRPNFHQIELRADTHLFISVLAYHILHVIEYKLRQAGDHRSWATIRDILSTHQMLTIEYNVKEQNQVKRHHLRVCGNAEPEHKRIYRNMGFVETPLPKKLHIVK
jgi:transposase